MGWGGSTVPTVPTWLFRAQRFVPSSAKPPPGELRSQQPRAGWRCHGGVRGGGGGRVDALGEREPIQHPRPTSRTLQPVLPAAGWASRAREPAPRHHLHGKPTLAMAERAAGPWHVGTEQAGPRRGERGRIGGRAGDTISLPAPQRQSDATGPSRCQKGLFHGSPHSPRRHLPFPEPPSPHLLDTGNWAIKSSLGRREGKAGRAKRALLLPPSFPGSLNSEEEEKRLRLQPWQPQPGGRQRGAQRLVPRPSWRFCGFALRHSLSA